MQRRRLADSFNAAIEGVIYVIKSQRNMRLHFLIGLMVVLLAMYLNIGKIETIVLILTISAVLITEMFNTAIERATDLITSDFHPLARIIKDISAGCVLIASISAVVVGYLLFVRHLTELPLDVILTRVKYSPWHVTFVALLATIVVVLIVKSFSEKGKPLRGGMPSGHAAVSFSLWTAITLLSENNLIIIIALIMAILITQSRVRFKIHSLWEVSVGALIGVLATLFCFQIFYQVFV